MSQSISIRFQTQQLSSNSFHSKIENKNILLKELNERDSRTDCTHAHSSPTTTRNDIFKKSKKKQEEDEIKKENSSHAQK